MSTRLHRMTLIALLLLAACAPQQETPAPVAVEPKAPAVVAPAPAADAAKPEIPTLVLDTFDGKKFDLAQQRGSWVVVNFWATWCAPCLKEIPDLDAFDKARKDVQVIGLAYEEIERADMEAFLKEHVFSYPVAVLDVYHPPADFETPRGLPMTYLIAPDGKVARQFLGPVTSRELAKAIVDHGSLATPATAAPDKG